MFNIANLYVFTFADRIGIDVYKHNALFIYLDSRHAKMRERKISLLVSLFVILSFLRILTIKVNK